MTNLDELEKDDPESLYTHREVMGLVAELRQARAVVEAARFASPNGNCEQTDCPDEACQLSQALARYDALTGERGKA